MTYIVRLLLGFALLTSGRKLYWLFVGIVGFMLGLSLAGLFFTVESEMVHLAIGLVAGVIGAVFALLLQRIAVALAGFISGGYILISLFDVLGWAVKGQYLPANWILFLIGGLIGAVLVALLFDWALILLSSLAGASLIVQTFEFTEWAQIFLFVFILVVGVGLQLATLRKENS
jgi:hypothetical protein